MLRIIGAISTFLLISLFGFAQDDSLRVEMDEELRFQLIPVPNDCAHGHICCEVGCNCCPELRRAQVYDTVDVTLFDNGSARYTIHERYRYARLHEMASVKYLFKDSAGRVTGTYFVPPPNYYFHTKQSTGEETIGEGRHNFWEQIVFDEHKIYHLINEKGAKLELTDYISDPLNEHLNRVSIFIKGFRIQGIMNSKGELLHRGFGYSWVSDFNGNFCTLVTETSGVSNLINTKGELLLKEGFLKMEDLTHGYVKVLNSNGWRLLDSTGHVLNRTSFDEIGRYSDGMFWVLKDNKHGFLNTNGKLVTNVKYEHIWPFSNGRAAVSLDDKWGFIDKTGKVVIPIQYDDVSMFGNGLAGVATGTDSNTDVWNLIDSMGNLVTEEVFDKIHPFNGGYAVVYRHPHGSGIIDTLGNIVVECKYAIENHNLYFPWKQNETVLLLDYNIPKAIIKNLKTGESIRLKDITSGSRAQITNKLEWLPHYVVRNNSNKKGMVDLKGNTLIETVYDELYVLDESRALVWQGEKMFIYNFNDSTNKLFVHGTLTLVPSTGYFNVKVGSIDRSFDYDGNEIRRF